MTDARFGALGRQDRGRVAEILAATGMFTPEEVAVGLELFDETFGTGAAAGSSAPYEFVGAFRDGDTLVGYACYGATPGTDGTFDLYWIAVDPAAQGGGTGSGLLGEVEQRLRERAARLLVAETSSRAAYAPTRRFYDRRGFDEAARVAAFYAPDDDRLIYTKRLTAKATSADRPPSPH